MQVTRCAFVKKISNSTSRPISKPPLITIFRLVRVIKTFPSLRRLVSPALITNSNHWIAETAKSTAPNNVNSTQGPRMVDWLAWLECLRDNSAWQSRELQSGIMPTCANIISESDATPIDENRGVKTRFWIRLVLRIHYNWLGNILCLKIESSEGFICGSFDLLKIKQQFIVVDTSISWNFVKLN